MSSTASAAHRLEGNTLQDSRRSLLYAHYPAPAGLLGLLALRQEHRQGSFHKQHSLLVDVARPLSGVDRNATVEDVKSGYRRMAKTFHPDGTPLS